MIISIGLDNDLVQSHCLNHRWSIWMMYMRELEEKIEWFKTKFRNKNSKLRAMSVSLFMQGVFQWRLLLK